MKKIILDSNEINPYLQRMGFQGTTGWDYERRLYDYELLYIISGDGRFEIDQSTYRVKDGSLLLIPPNTPTKFHILRSIDIRWVHFDFFYSTIGSNLEDANYYDVHVTQKELIRPKLYLSSGHQLPSVISVGDTERMTNQFTTLFDQFISPQKYNRLLCKSTFLQILHHILSQVENPQTVEQHPTKEGYIYEMRSYMEQNYYNDLTLNEITTYAGISPNYANKIFKEQTEMTIIQYLNHVRVEKAVTLLNSTAMKVEQIAAYVGIPDRHYFSRLVKKYTGKPPRDHRSV